MRKRTLIFLMACLMVSSPVLGQTKSTPTAKKDGAIDLGEEKVEGKVRKPEVFYVLVRERFRYESLSLTQSFVDLILKSTRSNPF